MTTKNKPDPTPDLPPDVMAEDLKYPGWYEKDNPDRGLRTDELTALGLSYESGWFGTFTFYKTERFGWVLTTLLIGKAGRRAPRGTTDRFYGITVKYGKGMKYELVTVGKGPHVTATATVYLKAGNIDRLRKYVELWKEGMSRAGDTRDRISTRRANTINRRRDLFGGGDWFS